MSDSADVHLGPGWNDNSDNKLVALNCKHNLTSSLIRWLSLVARWLRWLTVVFEVNRLIQAWLVELGV